MFVVVIVVMMMVMMMSMTMMMNIHFRILMVHESRLHHVDRTYQTHSFDLDVSRRPEQDESSALNPEWLKYCIWRSKADLSTMLGACTYVHLHALMYMHTCVHVTYDLYKSRMLAPLLVNFANPESLHHCW